MLSVELLTPIIIEFGKTMSSERHMTWISILKAIHFCTLGTASNEDGWTGFGLESDPDFRLWLCGADSKGERCVGYDGSDFGTLLLCNALCLRDCDVCLVDGSVVNET